MKQSTVNVIVILGVVIMALGAWTMPMYTAGLNRAAFDTLGNQLTDTQNDISNVEQDISGGGLEGGLDLASIGATTADQSTLQKALGSNFNTFSNKFIKQDSSASQFQTVEVKTFEPAKPREKLPNDFTGSSHNEVAGTPAATTCNADGTNFDAGTAGGVQTLSTVVQGPSSIDGFAILAPADLDGAGNANPAFVLLELQICKDPGGPVIVDEMMQIERDHMFTKNFAFGLIPPGSNLKVMINTDVEGGMGYKIWIFRDNPIVQPIRIINDVGGGLGNLGTQCTSITVNVKDGSAGGGGAAINGASVKLNHSFMPLIGNKFSAGAGQAVFAAADFGGVMPPGLYFVDVTPPPGGAATAFPFHTQVDCKTGNLTPTVTAILATATQFAGAVVGGSTAGALTVNIKDQSDAPLTNAFVKINAQFAPLIIKVCEDGSAVGTGCTNPETGTAAGDTLPVSTLIDAAADGTFQLTGLPLPGTTGGYGIGACKVTGGAPHCTFQSVTLTGAALTVTLTISIPS